MVNESIFIIGFRKGLEAFLYITIILQYLSTTKAAENSYFFF